MPEGAPPAGDDPLSGLDSTAKLLALVREGDRDARERLVARYLPALRRFAHGRLPALARGMVDTDDLVQVTLVRALSHVGGFEPRAPGSFHAYLRRSILNQIRDEVRRSARAPGRAELTGQEPSEWRSPLDETIGRQALERYEAGLHRLAPDQQEAIILRLELGFTYRQIAEALGRPSENAARMHVTRALVRLADAMGDVRGLP